MKDAILPKNQSILLVHEEASYCFLSTFPTLAIAASYPFPHSENLRFSSANLGLLMTHVPVLPQVSNAYLRL